MNPSTINQFRPHQGAFSSWLQSRGAIIHEPTNRYEVMRFDAVGGVALVYRKQNGTLTWTGNALAAWQAFQAGKDSWRPSEKVPRSTQGKRRRHAAILNVASRDGWSCIYCGCPLTAETATIEHVVPLSQGGIDRMVNMALACAECNHGLGDLPPAKKIAWAWAIRTKKAG
jgi:hypothetical protein